MRESGPLLLIGAALIVGSSLLAFLLEPRTRTSWDTYPSYLIGMSVAFGFVIAVAVGIGVCLYEVSPGISTFWRSRPIQPDVWFWTKFLTSGTLLMAVLYLPIAFAFQIAPTLHAPISAAEKRMLMCILLLHFATFASAAAMTCLVRNAVYAAILTIPMVFVGPYVVIAGLWVAWQLKWTGRASFPWVVFLERLGWSFAISAVVSTILAWLAFRNDWGVKGRG
jgi:hypothetical protein